MKTFTENQKAIIASWQQKMPEIMSSSISGRNVSAKERERESLAVCYIEGISWRLEKIEELRKESKRLQSLLQESADDDFSAVGGVDAVRRIAEKQMAIAQEYENHIDSSLQKLEAIGMAV